MDSIGIRNDITVSCSFPLSPSTNHIEQALNNLFLFMVGDKANFITSPLLSSLSYGGINFSL